MTRPSCTGCDSDSRPLREQDGVMLCPPCRGEARARNEVADLRRRVADVMKGHWNNGGFCDHDGFSWPCWTVRTLVPETVEKGSCLCACHSGAQLVCFCRAEDAEVCSVEKGPTERHDSTCRENAITTGKPTSVQGET